MKKISLKGISEILSERELKNVLGGSAHFYQGDIVGFGCMHGQCMIDIAWPDGGVTCGISVSMSVCEQMRGITC